MIALLLLFLLAIAPSPADAQDSLAAPMRPLLAAGRHPWASPAEFGAYAPDLERLYAARGDRPIWYSDARLSPAGTAAIAQLGAAGVRGLDPEDYNATLLDSLAREAPRAPLAPSIRARLDLLLSLELFRYLDDLRRGRLHPNPLGARGSDAIRFDLAGALSQAITADSVPGLVAAMEPKLVQYHNLRQALVLYRQLAADSALPDLPITRTVHPGAPYAGLAALERRLIGFGDLALDSARHDSAGMYLGPVVGAVERFQIRHGLEPDGVLGPATLAELRTPLAWRVRQIELALERLRWLPPIHGQRIVVVNIPAFQLFAFDSAGRTGSPGLEMKVIVGRALHRRTPVLVEQMRYVEFWPYWNVPRSILLREILPELRKQSGYLRANDMELVGARDIAVGDHVTPDVLDRLARGELRVRQRPGPTNPLWLTKFVFPNAADVYLHGTPRSELFSRTRRDFSHGCIRLKNPVALVNWVLRDQPAWPPDSVDAALRGARTIRALLAHPLPVAIFYTTTVVRPDGSTWFYRDIYGQDHLLDKALRARPARPQSIAEARLPG
jgi:murein L,D-transpeptidase YcbB/YkuD